MALNLQSLKQEFLDYLAKIGKQDSVDAKEFMKSTSSIFSMSGDFKNFLKNEKHINPEEIYGSLSQIIEQNIKDGQLVKSDKNDDNGNNSNNNGSLGVVSDFINDLLKQDKVKEAIDVDGTEGLSEKEITDFLNALEQFNSSDEGITLQDMFDVMQAIEDGTFDYRNSNEGNVQSASPAGSVGSSGGTGGVGGNGGVQNGGQQRNAGSSDSVENMSEEKLKEKLVEAENERDTNKDKLKALQDGTDPTLQNMQTKIDEAYKAYHDELDKVDKDLAKQLDDDKKAVEDQEKLISDKDKEITDQKTTIADAKTSYEGAKQTTAQLKQRKSELDSKTDAKLIESIDKSIITAENAEANAKTAYDNAEDRLKELEKEREELETGEGGLKEKKEKLAETEKTIAEKYPQLQDLQKAYETAEQEYDKYKAEEITKAQAAVETSQAKVDELNNELTNRVRNTLMGQFSTSSLKGKYNLNGVEYNTVLDQSKLDAMVNAAANGGAGTKYGHADTCLSIAYTYGLWATGDSNRGYSNSGVWNYGDAGKYEEFKSDSKDTVLAKIKEELDAGRPVVLHVNGKSNSSRHYVTVVGYKSSAGGTLSESDLLIWDSYASTIRNCGDSKGRHMITGYDTGRDSYGYQIYIRR